MPIGIQIKTFLIPRRIWEGGHEFICNGVTRRTVAPARVAQDALAIERRAWKRVNLLNEARRYAQCCERLQTLAVELFMSGAPLAPAVIWPVKVDSDEGRPRALALLAFNNYAQPAMDSYLQRKGQPGMEPMRSRFMAVFIPPDAARVHLDSLTVATRNVIGEAVFEESAKKFPINHPNLKITSEEVRASFKLRSELVLTCVRDDLGLVDVVEIG